MENALGSKKTKIWVVVPIFLNQSYLFLTRFLSPKPGPVFQTLLKDINIISDDK